MNMGSYKCQRSGSSQHGAIQSLSSFLKLIAEENRLRLLCILRTQDRCVCEIMEDTGMSQSLVSHHLRDLKKVRMVDNEKKGNRVYYTMTKRGTRITDLLFSIS